MDNRPRAIQAADAGGDTTRDVVADRAGLHLVAAEILVVEVFQPFAQLFVIANLGHRRHALRRFQHGVLNEDWAIEAQSDRQRVAGTGIDRNHLPRALQPDDRVKRVVFQIADDHFFHAGFEAEEKIANQITSEKRPTNERSETGLC